MSLSTLRDTTRRLQPQLRGGSGHPELGDRARLRLLSPCRSAFWPIDLIWQVSGGMERFSMTGLRDSAHRPTYPERRVGGAHSDNHRTRLNLLRNGHCDRRPSNETRTYRERRISVSGRQRPLDFGPYRAPGICVGDREPVTDGGRVMWGLERVVDYNTSPVVQRRSVRSRPRLSSGCKARIDRSDVRSRAAGGPSSGGDCGLSDRQPDPPRRSPSVSAFSNGPGTRVAAAIQSMLGSWRPGPRNCDR
jgi:hypothetical protein